VGQRRCRRRHPRDRRRAALHHGRRRLPPPRPPTRSRQCSAITRSSTPSSAPPQPATASPSHCSSREAGSPVARHGGALVRRPEGAPCGVLSGFPPKLPRRRPGVADDQVPRAIARGRHPPVRGTVAAIGDDYSARTATPGCGSPPRPATSGSPRRPPAQRRPPAHRRHRARQPRRSASLTALPRPRSPRSRYVLTAVGMLV
jgi:hypothetical protein